MHPLFAARHGPVIRFPQLTCRRHREKVPRLHQREISRPGKGGLPLSSGLRWTGRALHGSGEQRGGGGQRPPLQGIRRGEISWICRRLRGLDGLWSGVYRDDAAAALSGGCGTRGSGEERVVVLAGCATSLTAWLVFCFLYAVAYRTRKFFSLSFGPAAPRRLIGPNFAVPMAVALSERPTPIHWNIEKGENIRWHTPIAGLAHSSPLLGKCHLPHYRCGSGNQDVKVGLYGDIASADDQESHQWRLLALEKIRARSCGISWAMKEFRGANVIPNLPTAIRPPRPMDNGSRHLWLGRIVLFSSRGQTLWKKCCRMKSGSVFAPSAQWDFQFAGDW